jgi:hypothetical protein
MNSLKPIYRIEIRRPESSPNRHKWDIIEEGRAEPAEWSSGTFATQREARQDGERAMLRLIARGFAVHHKAGEDI